MELKVDGTVLTFGEPVASFSPDSRGHISKSHRFQPYIGGAELNTAVGLSRLGVKTSFAASVGDDAMGKMILSALREEGVETAFLHMVSGFPTAILFKEWTGLTGGTSIYYYRTESPMAKGHWDVELLIQSLGKGRWDWAHTTGITFMLGSHTKKAAMEVLERSHAQGSTISFDANVRLKLGGWGVWRAEILGLLPLVDWFILGEGEASGLFGLESVVEIETAIRDSGFNGHGVILKRGINGVDSSLDGIVTSIPARAVDSVVDTVGAGDGFNAGWIAAMTSGWSLRDALTLGTIVGAYAVTSIGDHTGYPFQAEALNEFCGEEVVER